MSEYVILALEYVYCHNMKALKTGSVKGIRLKQIMDYKKMIDSIAEKIEKKEVLDLEEVLRYGY